MLPRPVKRTRDESHTKYPTPVPTSSTGILSSSPPRVLQGRPSGQRSNSTVSEKRAPLGAVPSLDLPENGDYICMGRSSSSSHYQLSANRLISRVHVKARYIPAPSLLESAKIEVICTGWNGLKLHCQGRTWELGKGDTFSSETEQAEIMLDVQDARVRLHWPRKHPSESAANLSDASWDDSPCPQRSSVAHASPLRRRAAHIASPESPTPANGSNSNFGLLETAGEEVKIYEDTEELELPALPRDNIVDPNASMCTIPVEDSFSSELSDPEENDPNEENDPIVHSFGPFGANISGKLAAFTHNSPKIAFSPGRSIVSARAPLGTLKSPRSLGTIASDPLRPSRETVSKTLDAPNVARVPSATKSGSPTPELGSPYNKEAITNHVVNQLAFSRLSSSPVSLILRNLSTEERNMINKEQLIALLNTIDCIGMITRTGKDAAGKLLECEFYYIPDKDIDLSRKNAVTQGLGRPSLRACRKQHKQYYWKRPRTP